MIIHINVTTWIIHKVLVNFLQKQTQQARNPTFSENKTLNLR